VNDSGKQQGSKMRERVDAVEQRMAALDSLLAGLQRSMEEATVKIADLQQQLAEQTAKADAAILAITKAGGIQISQAATLEADDLAELLEQEPGRRLICVSGSPQLGLRPGEAFDPRAKFSHPLQAQQFVSSGVTFAAAPT